MTMQVSSKVAKLGSRLVAMARRHRALEERIADVESRPKPDSMVIQRLKREKLRLKDEMHYCEGMLRSTSRGLPT